MFKVEVDISALSQAITAMPERLRRRCMEASSQTAVALQREMRQRLARQLSPAATGVTVQSIVMREAYDGNGYVVLTERQQYPELPLWLEKGTRPGRRKNFARTEARPFFYASIELEAPAHERRILAAANHTSEEGV